MPWGTAQDPGQARNTLHPIQTTSAAGNKSQCSAQVATEQRVSSAVRILLRRTSRPCCPLLRDLHPETQRLTQGSARSCRLRIPLLHGEFYYPLAQLREADSHRRGSLWYQTELGHPGQ